MSTPTQQTLGDVSGTVADGQTATKPAWDVTTKTETSKRRCGNCGSHVGMDFVRVFCADDGKVHACPNCASHAAIRNGAAAKPDFDGSVDR